MKNSFIFGILLIPLICFSQNLEDAYGDRTGCYTGYPKLEYQGEYQIFLDQLYWSNTSFQQAYKTFSIKVMSFPFIPVELEFDSQNTSSMLYTGSRTFDTELMQEDNEEYYLGHIDQSGNNYNYIGNGWKFGDFYIFRNLYSNTLNNCNNPTEFMCQGDYDLISIGYVGNMNGNALGGADGDACIFPHTILKHTIFFHCGDDANSPIVDSLSWIYDNTRGKMRKYPFQADNTPVIEKAGSTIIHIYDVLFRPTFMLCDLPYNPEDYSPYDPNNADWYNSGMPDNSGSADYFPIEEVLPYYDNCLYHGVHPLYPNPLIGKFKTTEPTELLFIHPSSYALLDAPLLNATGEYWAGYKSGDSTDMPGMWHEYRIDHNIDLKKINSSEKIIYNPRYVDVNHDLVFPCGYKFLTLHGKYPDRDNEVLDYYELYWAFLGISFRYERDYPTPINSSTNAECTTTDNEYCSHYTLGEAVSITIEPAVIIMDAYFSGSSKEEDEKGVIIYDPNYTFGNWDYDPETIKLEPITWHYPDFALCMIAAGVNLPPEESIILGNDNKYPINNIHENIGDETMYFNISNNPSSNVSIKFLINDLPNQTLMIYNIDGILVCSIQVNNNIVTYVNNDLERGLYYAVLTVNGEIVQRQKFYIIKHCHPTKSQI